MNGVDGRKEGCKMTRTMSEAPRTSGPEGQMLRINNLDIK
jgi:hypothetical protein